MDPHQRRIAGQQAPQAPPLLDRFPESPLEPIDPEIDRSVSGICFGYLSQTNVEESALAEFYGAYNLLL